WTSATPRLRPTATPQTSNRRNRSRRRSCRRNLRPRIPASTSACNRAHTAPTASTTPKCSAPARVVASRRQRYQPRPSCAAVEWAGMASLVSRSPVTLTAIAALVALPAQPRSADGRSANTVWAQPAGSLPLPPGSEDAPIVDAPTTDTTTPSAPAIDPKYVDAARKLAALADDDTRAWDRLAYMADTFGHRLSGSE